MAELNPRPGDSVTIGYEVFTFEANPNPIVKHLVYSMEGARGTVYKVKSGSTGKQYALKKFRARWRTKNIEESANSLRAFKQVAGLAVCDRTVLTPEYFKDLVNEYSDLNYAALMPWIDGLTWFDCIANSQSMDQDRSLALAHSMARTLAQLEGMSAAHADIAGANVVVGSLTGSRNQNQPVNLVDVEEMYGPTMPQPIEIPAGQAGYRHKTASTQGNWHPAGDRFGGAVILSEMLGWHNPRVRAVSSGEGYYFVKSEMQNVNSNRYKTLHEALKVDYSPDVARLFDEAWLSPTPMDCPPLGEWAGMLNKLTAGTATVPAGGAQGPVIGRRPVGGGVPGVVPAPRPAPSVNTPVAPHPSGSVGRRAVGADPSAPAASPGAPQAGPVLPRPPQYQASQGQSASVQRVAPGTTGTPHSTPLHAVAVPVPVRGKRPTVVNVMIALHIVFAVAALLAGLVAIFNGVSSDDWVLLIVAPLCVLYTVAARGLFDMREWGRKVTVVLLVMSALAGFAGLVGFLAIIPLIMLNKAEIKNQFT